MSTSRRRFLKSAVAVDGVTLGQRLEALPGSPPGVGGPAARAAGSAAPVQEWRLPNMDPGTDIGPEGYGALDENSVHYVAIRVKVDAHFVHLPGEDTTSGLWAEAAIDGLNLRARGAGYRNAWPTERQAR